MHQKSHHLLHVCWCRSGTISGQNLEPDSRYYIKSSKNKSSTALFLGTMDRKCEHCSNHLFKAMDLYSIASNYCYTSCHWPGRAMWSTDSQELLKTQLREKMAKNSLRCTQFITYRHTEHISQTAAFSANTEYIPCRTVLLI